MRKKSKRKRKIDPFKLTPYEKSIERAIARGEYRPAPEAETRKTLAAIAEFLASRKKDAVLNIRVNSQDLANIKKKAKKMGVPYQSFVSEIIHKYAAD